ncbi:hypothetical protein [uncultured Mediterranean phage uvMED]|jgi:hypothetical protein|nr:hypothetical protein [uncultured Mediterranean phage uvMED]|tara:strand:- start:3 stop:266 length:264 start_codon:yes stop_codon:yes gene_type:complete
MSDLQIEANRGTRAKAILEDELFQEALETLRKSYTEAIFQTGPNDELARTKIYLAYQILGKFGDHFRTVMETGQLASKQLEELRKKK